MESPAAKDAAPKRRSREGGLRRLSGILSITGGKRRRNCDRRSARRAIPKRFHVSTSGICVAFTVTVPGDKRYVYVLKNGDSEPQFYVGLTSDVRARLSDHNTGRCPHTARRRPWQLHVVIEFLDEPRALRFERYLKSGSGRAFAKRHFEE